MKNWLLIAQLCAVLCIGYTPCAYSDFKVVGSGPLEITGDDLRKYETSKQELLTKLSGIQPAVAAPAQQKPQEKMGGPRHGGQRAGSGRGQWQRQWGRGQRQGGHPGKGYGARGEHPGKGFGRDGKRHNRWYTPPVAATDNVQTQYREAFDTFMIAITKDKNFPRAQAVIDAIKKVPSIQLKDIENWQALLNIAVQAEQPKKPIETEDEAKARRAKMAKILADNIEEAASEEDVDEA